MCVTRLAAPCRILPLPDLSDLCVFLLGSARTLDLWQISDITHPSALGGFGEAVGAVQQGAKFRAIFERHYSSNGLGRARCIGGVAM